MRRSLLALLKDTAPAILPLLSCMTTFSQQSCCYFSQLKDYPLLTSHPLSSHCSISLLPFLAKPSQRFLYSVFPESSLLWFSNSLLSGLPSLLHSSGLACQTNAQFLSSLRLCLSAPWDMPDLSLLGLPSSTPLSSHLTAAPSQSSVLAPPPVSVLGAQSPARLSLLVILPSPAALISFKHDDSHIYFSSLDLTL